MEVEFHTKILLQTKKGPLVQR